MIYLQLDRQQGNFFEYSSEEKEGFEKHTSTKGNTSFRKHYKRPFEGTLESIGKFDGKFGQQISVNIKEADGNVYVLQFELKDQYKYVNTEYVEDLLKFMPNLEKGDNISFNVYNFIPKGEAFSKSGIAIKKDGVKVEKALRNSYYAKETGELVQYDIPAIKWRVLDGETKKTPTGGSQDDRSEYLISFMNKQLERFAWKKDDSPTAKAEPTKATKTPEDSLPF